MRALSEAKFKGEARPAYCGPYAISAITGKTIDAVEDALNKRRGHPPGTRVKTTWSQENKYIVRNLGFNATTVFKNRGPNRCGPTFATWLRERKGPDMQHSYLVLVTKHWVAVKGRKMIDTFTGTPVFIGKAPHRRKRVQVVIRIEK